MGHVHEGPEGVALEVGYVEGLAVGGLLLLGIEPAVAESYSRFSENGLG